MTPAMFLFGIACAIIQNVESDKFACPKHVTGNSEGLVSIKCEYSQITKANMYTRKYFCKEGGRRGRCQNVIASTNGYKHPNYEDRVIIEDNTKEGAVIITYSDLRKTDEGAYIVGLGTDANGLKDVVTLTITEDSVIPNEAKLVYGQLRGAANFHCEFGDEYAKKRQYFCKTGKLGCQNIIDSTLAIDPAYYGRIILQADEKRPGSFTVKIIQLRMEDSGSYSCGVGNFGGDGETIEFDLRINEETDIPQGSRLLSTRLGGSISALCNYDSKKDYTLKFWCKLDGSVCTPLINTDGYVKDDFEGKLAIHDDPINGTMQVLMNQITKEDEGWYWCVVTDGKHDQTSTVQIKISEGSLEGLTGGQIINVKAGETIKIPCAYPCRFNTHQKYWCKLSGINCKEVISHVDDDERGLSVSCETRELVLTIETISQKDSGWYWCGVKKDGKYGKTIAVRVIVEAIQDDPDIEAARDVPNSDTGRRANLPNEKISPTSTTVNNQSALVPAILSVCAAVLVACGVFFIIRLRRKKNSDLVSVGSYRTNISMTDLDNVIGKDNHAVTDTQETNVSHSKDGEKNKKKGSQENLEYTNFLIHHNGSPNEENTA
ncbi:polymeric immunoglobulin receptor-like isoform X2 [Dendrobates tinctorius]|uniref:polymeric immunoglobulin receptor-like isoform X2 n=1 Tax=Dendrobates tinctorius TaxID=92724 RepID=UPI003CC923C6